MFKIIRIALLLLILASVSSTLLIQKNVVREWRGVLNIHITPVIADQKSQTKEYVDSLSEKQFNDIERYLITQAKRFDLNLNNSFNIQLEKSITNIPPETPGSRASRLNIMLWSLKLRWWAWQNKLEDQNISQIRLYLLYQSPADGQVLAHSTGLQNGLIGLVNARASTQQEPLHTIIIIHELLHIFGASDKYDLRDGLPIYPSGYVNSDQKPLFPQSKAEIMARSIPITENRADVATNLNNIVIGQETASEIGWFQ